MSWIPTDSRCKLAPTIRRRVEAEFREKHDTSGVPTERYARGFLFLLSSSESDEGGKAHPRFLFLRPLAHSGAAKGIFRRSAAGSESSTATDHQCIIYSSSDRLDFPVETIAPT